MHTVKPTVQAAADHLLALLAASPETHTTVDLIRLAVDSGLPVAIYAEALDMLSNSGSVSLSFPLGGSPRGRPSGLRVRLTRDGASATGGDS